MTTEVEDKLAEIAPVIRGLARLRIGNQSWAYDDAIQEAMLVAWLRLSEGYTPGVAIHQSMQAVVGVLRGRRMTGSKWTYGGSYATGAHQHASSIHREDGEGVQYLKEPADTTTTDLQDQMASLDALRAPLGVLSAREREIIYLRFWEGQEHAEIAQRLGVTRQAISVALKRAMPKLKVALESSETPGDSPGVSR